jgi:hypothetical protein
VKVYRECMSLSRDKITLTDFESQGAIARVTAEDERFAMLPDQLQF